MTSTFAQRTGDLPGLTTIKYVALYCRISVDRNGRKEGVKAQEVWGRDYAAKHWPGVPIIVFGDNDLSAMKDDVVRPEFEKLKAAIIRGDIAHLWAVEQSRTERDEIRWFQFAAELDAAGIEELHTNRDGIVRVRDEVAGIKAVINASEVRKLRRRVKDKKLSHATLGMPSGGNYFGYRSVVREDGVRTLEIVEEQAKHIRWAADKVLCGWSLQRIVNELRRKGVRGAMGGQVWNPTLKSWFSPYSSGLRVHHGEVIGPANWPAILDNETRLTVVARLAKPRTVKNARNEDHEVGAVFYGRSTTRKHLLTGGIAVCGVCGVKLSAVRKRQRATGERYSYLRCTKVSGGNACVGIKMDPTVEAVLDNLWEALSTPAFLDAIAADEHRARRDQLVNSLGALDAQRRDLAAMWGSGQLDNDEWTVARKGIAARESGLRAELTAIPPAALNLGTITAARDSWDDMTLDERRAFVCMFIERVEIHRALTMGPVYFDPRRVKIVWKEVGAAKVA